MAEEIKVKICGLKDPVSVHRAAECGADFAGFVFVPASPRFISAFDAKALCADIPERMKKTALFCDPSDDRISEILKEFKADVIQLHGAEPPERVTQIRSLFSLPVIKALPLSEPFHQKEYQAYDFVADMILSDAPPQAGDVLTGGNGRLAPLELFNIVKTLIKKPHFFAGGLTPENVTRIIRRTGAGAVDVSGGVESERGVKDPEKIAIFIQNARNAVKEF